MSIPDLDIYEPPAKLQANCRERAREIIHALMLERNAEKDRADTLAAAIEAMRVADGSVEFQAAFDRAKKLIAPPPIEDDDEL